ncbi:MAG: hypothetical protein FWH27_16540 [Planctomycetaceae bacterium]|nr:hypothetical protein [Planctomycetaceae bacterium]
MSRRSDVVKLVRITLCFAGVVFIVSGMEFGLTRLAIRTPLRSFAETGDVILYVAGMTLYCPLVFAQAALGLVCIRYNKLLARLCGKYSRTPNRIGKQGWKFSELHALMCVALGAFLCAAGIMNVLETLRYVIDMTCFQDRSFGTPNVSTFLFLSLLSVPAILMIYLVPGVLLIRFARQWTGITGRKLRE